MALQGSSATLQGGTGISLPNYNPQRATSFNVQPAIGVPLYNSAQLYTPKANAAIKSSQANTDSTAGLQGEIAALLRQLNAANRQAYAPPIDYNAIYNKANAQAQEAVNPLYTKQLNDFLAQQAAKKRQNEEQSQANITNLEDTLKNTLASGEIAKTRSAEDTATNIGEINTAADQFQTDTGQQFDASRITQAEDLAKSGLTGGLGAQQAESSTLARNTTEGRQEQKFQNSRTAQELSKARNFEDISRAGELASQTKEKGVKQEKFDLASFIENQGFETNLKKTELEGQRLLAVLQKQSTIGKGLVANFIAAISDPAQRDAATRAYSGLF